jgi:alpha-galactosidase
MAALPLSFDIHHINLQNNQWYDVMSTLDEKVVRDTADALVSTGLAAVGYNYINLDDCWAQRNSTTGKIMADPKKWTNGTLKSIADYVHSKDLLFGTCKLFWI